MSVLFSPLRLRGTTFRNRIFVSPMCQYSSRDGLPTEWHLVHLGSRAVGGAALVIVEATAVCPEGRISPGDSGLWSRAHAEAFKPMAAFIRAQGALPAIQLAHAGRKASTAAPWDGGKAVAPSAGGWTPLAPSPGAFAPGYAEPREMTDGDVQRAIGQFAAAARLAREAGFEAIELHLAHGYLAHEFLSPLVNKRTDRWGGSRENRMRFALELARAARAEWPDDRPVLARVSATDWTPGGWDLPDSIALASALKGEGVDLIDCSSGGAVPGARIPVGPGYQAPFAEAIRRDAGVPTGAVGLITRPEQAEELVAAGKADAVLLARELLRDPYWPLRAAKALKAEAPWPKQYLAARD